MRSNDHRFFCRSGAIGSEMLYVPPMNIRLLARRALTSSPIVPLAVLACSGTAAAATNQIEGVWSFSGGAVAIQPAPSNTFQGVVVSPTTTFGACPHPEGEVIWTNMELQPGGYFLGLHQWYTGKGATCAKDPTLGHTAWRVLTSSGARVLKVCFNKPGDETQPSIAANGGEANVSYGCEESSPLAALPETEVPGGKGNPGSGVITFSKTVVLPPATGCVAQSSLKIALKDPKYDPLKEVVVKLNGKKVADIKGIKAIKKGITLKKLPSSGTYKISVVATTVLKQRLTGSQTYKSCTKGSGKIKLKKVKTLHG
jgi:hypothetical protein